MPVSFSDGGLTSWAPASFRTLVWTSVKWVQWLPPLVSNDHGVVQAPRRARREWEEVKWSGHPGALN